VEQNYIFSHLFAVSLPNFIRILKITRKKKEEMEIDKENTHVNSLLE
jgi:hypothetical protein